MGWMERWRRRLRVLTRPDEVERELDEELALHLEMETEKNLRAGMTPEEARRRAALAFGAFEARREEVRDARALGWVGGLSLDFKLGARMLVKYPGLTAVGGLAIAFAIWVGAGTFQVVNQLLHPALPLDDGDRIVGIRLWHLPSNGIEEQALFDFARWSEGVRSVEDLGAFRTVQRNLIPADGRGMPVLGAEMSAAGFRVARVPPLLGRHLLEGDEEPGAPEVVVLGYDLWRTAFAADPALVGRRVRLGAAEATVVGVMPEGFAFPVNHGLWLPFRLDPRDFGPREGPQINVFGRLAPGASLEEARAEVETIARRAAADYPATHEQLRAEVLPYAESTFPIRFGLGFRVGMLSINLGVLLLLVLVCGNVALLMFSRVAARESEIAVRTALGASRARIVTQLFVESLVLAVVAGLVGVAAGGLGLRWGMGILEFELEQGLPFWFSARLEPVTVLYAFLLAAVGAAVAGVVPALRVTGQRVEPHLRRGSTGGGGASFGGGWTALIVTQVAVTVAFPAAAFLARREMVQIERYDVGVPVEEYLAARLEMDREPPPGQAVDTTEAGWLARYEAAYREVERRVSAEPAVTGVTFAGRLPRMYHPWHQVEVAEGSVEPPDARGHRMGSVAVDPDYFEVLGAPVLAGRAFTTADVESGARVAIVNEPFVEQVLGGRNAIGQHLRIVASESARTPRFDGPWYEIVGVVGDLGTQSGYGRAGVYQPIPAGGAYPLHVAVHVRGRPETFAPRLLAAVTDVDPSLRVHEPMALDDAVRDDVAFMGFWFWLIVLLCAVALTLSLAGIYSVMSFTVARRTREIGIRRALGAEPARILLAVFRRPLARLVGGVLAGGALVAVLMQLAEGPEIDGGMLLGVAAYALLMTAVCLLACIGPTRRALRIEPTEAMRADA